MPPDARTIAAYDARVAAYADLTDGAAKESLKRFVADLPEGARVLDLGCGPGTDAAAMVRAGLRVDAVDAAPGMVALAVSRGVAARVATFDDLDAAGAYDGVWASFSLLHARRADLPRHLAAIARALRPGGQLHIGMKTGTGAARDALDRLYTYVTVADLHVLLRDAGLTVTDTREGTGTGLAGTCDPFVICRAGKAG